jgi:tetratricopeptide (TPR) repeat protein
VNIQSLFTVFESLKEIRGIEGSLRRRRRNGILATIITLMVGIIGVIRQLDDKAIEEYIAHVMSVTSYTFGYVFKIVSFQWASLPDYRIVYDVWGFYVILIGVVVYYLNRHTSFLFTISEEPFHYSFWVGRFKRAEDLEEKSASVSEDDRIHHLLHHDLMDMLNKRIGRFSLLEEPSSRMDDSSENDTGRSAAVPPSHIHIDGHYTIRPGGSNGGEVIQVMPRVRIGPAGNPSILTHPVEIELPVTDNGESYKDSIDELYNRVLEQVYFKIASEIYRQIKLDIGEKMKLFPSGYLRAVALFHEAKDFERSNTIDAYDHAIELYTEAKRYFDTRYTGLLNDLLVRIPLLWRLTRRASYIEARIRAGYCTCLIYRRIISALSGRSLNNIFDVLDELGRAKGKLLTLYNNVSVYQIDTVADRADGTDGEHAMTGNRHKMMLNFLTYPNDNPFHRTRGYFDQVRYALFDVFTVSSLAYSSLHSVQRAETELRNARSIAPVRSQRNSLWLLAAAECEADIGEKLHYLRNAAELTPDFEIVQYQLAYWSEMDLRMQDDMSGVETVIKEYNKVLKINPGNIGALAAEGYLYWLRNRKDDLDRAQKKFEEGVSLKAMVQQTFIGDLSLGLARIHAERGDFRKSYYNYLDAINADPSVGAYTKGTHVRTINSFYVYIGETILKRYAGFLEHVREHLVFQNGQPVKTKNPDSESAPSGRMVKTVYSFVLNDCGNAHLNYYHRFGQRARLDRAIKLFNDALAHYSDNTIVTYNLQNANYWSGKPVTDILAELEEDKKLASIWHEIIIDMSYFWILHLSSNLNNHYQRSDQLEEEIKSRLSKLFAGTYATKKQTPGQTNVPQATQAADTTDNQKDFDLSQLIEEGASLKIKIEEEKESLMDILHETKKWTKLSSLFDGLNITYEGDGVREFIDQRIEKDRLDEIDITVLILWAEILSSNPKNTTALANAEKLCLFIENYYPDDIDTNRILQSVYTKMSSLDKKEGQMWERKRLSRVAVYNSFVKSWLASDPAHYTSLIRAKENYHPEDAAAAFKRAIKLCPDSDILIYELGNIYHYTTREYVKAIEQYEHARSLNGDEDRYRKELARAYADLGGTRTDEGNYEGAERAYKKSLEFDDTDHININALGNLYFNTRRFPRAAVCYCRAIKINEGAAVYHANLGLAYSYMSLPDLAISAYENAIARDATNPRYYNELGVIYYDKGEYEKAIEYYMKAIKINDKVAVYHANLGLAYMDLENYGEAENAYNKATELDESDHININALGNLYFRTERYGKAAECYLKAIEKSDGVAVYHSNLGLSYRNLKKWDEAIAAFSAAIERDTQNSRYYNDLGVSYHDTGNYEKAIEFYRKAINLDDRHDVYYDNLRLAYTALGKIDEAESINRNNYKQLDQT